MLDGFGREISYLRLSITERCTLRCTYCRSDEGFCPRAAELNWSELVRITAAFAALGVKRVRLTGGEPLLRRDLREIIAGIRALPTIEDISLTTNAQMLAEQAAGLKQAGLDRVNISLDSLDQELFYQLCGGDLAKVLAGIDAALSAGLRPVKINVVLIRGQNDREVDDFINLTIDRPLDVRFIEYMPVGTGNHSRELRINNQDLIAQRPELQPLPPRNPGQPSQDFQLPGALGRVGFISPLSHKFCSSCNRVRVMSDGRLRTCLGQESEFDLRPALQSGDDALLTLIQQAVSKKPESHQFEDHWVADRNMSRIGG